MVLYKFLLGRRLANFSFIVMNFNLKIDNFFIILYLIRNLRVVLMFYNQPKIDKKKDDDQKEEYFFFKSNLKRI